MRLVERAMEPWSPEVHLELWPLSFRSGVRQVFLVGGRSRVPTELWLHIMLSFCGCDWFQPVFWVDSASVAENVDARE